MNIHVHIERLVLDGLAMGQAQRPVFRAAVEAELGRLLAAGGLSPELANGAAVPRVAGGTVAWAAGSSPEGGPARLGEGVARAVYGGIGEGRSDA